MTDAAKKMNAAFILGLRTMRRECGADTVDRNGPGKCGLEPGHDGPHVIMYLMPLLNEHGRDPIQQYAHDNPEVARMAAEVAARYAKEPAK